MRVSVNTLLTDKWVLGTSTPCFAHVTTGSGMPVALHWKVAFEFGEATKDSGETITCGGTKKE